MIRAALLLPLLLCACPGKRSSGDATTSVVPAAEREGNDRELVKLFKALPRACSYQNGRLDYSCAALKELRRRLELKRAQTASRAKARTTLSNLLESEEELIRLVAAEGLFFHLREPGTVTALEAALRRERAPTTRATILRQLCFGPGPVDGLARPLLGKQHPEAARAEAAGCFARGPRAKRETIAELRQCLRTDPSPVVRGNACAALGAQRAAEAIPELALAARQPGIAHRCASALAAIGTAPAYQALAEAAAAALEQGRVPVQLIAALTSFAGQSFFEKEKVHALLSRVIADGRLSVLARTRAVAELARLGAKPELRRLRSLIEPDGVGAKAVLELLEREAR